MPYSKVWEFSGHVFEQECGPSHLTNSGKHLRYRFTQPENVNADAVILNRSEQASVLFPGKESEAWRGLSHVPHLTERIGV